MRITRELEAVLYHLANAITDAQCRATTKREERAQLFLDNRNALLQLCELVHVEARRMLVHELATEPATDAAGLPATSVEQLRQTLRKWELVGEVPGSAGIPGKYDAEQLLGQRGQTVHGIVLRLVPRP